MAKAKITPLYERLSRDDELNGESFSIQNQDVICRGWIHHPIHCDYGSFVVICSVVTRKGVIWQ